SDLKKLGLKDGEWEELAAQHRRLAHGSSLLAGAQSSLEALSEADGALLSQLSAVAGRLRALSEHDVHLKAIVEMLESAEVQAAEAARDLRDYASRVDLDPEAQREVAAAKERYESAAKKLSAKRKTASQALGRAVTQAMQNLAMVGGRFAAE